MEGLDTRLFIPREKSSLARLRLPGAGERHDLAGQVGGVLFLVLVLLGPIMTFHTADEGESFSALRQGGYLLALALSGYCLQAKAEGWTAFLLPAPIFLVLGWCWASVFWALDPDTSLRRVFLTTTVVFSAFWLVRGLGYDRFIGQIRIGLAILLVVNFLAVFFLPVVGIQIEVGRTSSGVFWRGIMADKNFAGAVCALTILVFLFDAAGIDLRRRLTVIILACAFLVQSISKTSIGMVVTAAVATWIFKRFDGRRRIFLVLGTLLIAIIAFSVMSASPDGIRQYTSDPTLFTGRGLIWMALLRYSAEHPLLGAGFESFWNIGSVSPIHQYGIGFTTLVTVGHMGYLDLLVTIGYPGLVLAVFAMVIWPMVRLFGTSNAVIERASLVCALLVFSIGHNFTESSLFERDAFVGVFMMFAIAILYSLPGGVGRRSARRADAGAEVMRTLRRRKRTIPV
jgi:O-antigen ligase